MGALLIVGIDGLPHGLAAALIAEGRTPALADLAERGSLGILTSTPNYQSASAWTSLVTGVNPGKHGILHFTNPVRGSYALAQIDARARRAPSLWRLLSERGLRVAALNFPVSYPAEPVAGVMIAGWLCPAPDAPGFSHPPDLAGAIAARWGDYPIHADVRRHAVRGDFEAAARAAERGLAAKGEVAAWLIERDRPDLAGVVFTELDSLQHWCWHILDERHPEHDPALALRWRERLLAVYARMDEQVGALVGAAGGDANVLVVSDHGQAPNSGAQVLLRPWLVAAGYLTPRRRPLLRRVVDRLSALGFEAIKSRAPARVKAALRARLPGLQGRAQAGMGGIAADWARTQAWTETGHIFVNQAGRWPEGIVEPGPATETLLAELAERLAELRDAHSGEPLVAGTERGAAQFHGPQADLMPDLLVHWRHDLRTTAAQWRGRRIAPARPPTLPPGAHHPDGTLIASGPSFRALVDAPAQSIYDVAPTAKHLLGQAVPESMDGRVMTQVLTESAAQEVCIEAVNHAAQGVAEEAAHPADEVVLRRLRSLGYIDQG